MALFVRRNTEGDNLPLYSTSSSESILIIGLGNIGGQYDQTRHNVGFASIDAFAQLYNFPKWTEKKQLYSYITKASVGGKNIILAKPTTYMNESGRAAQAIQSFYKITNTKTIVVHDDLDVDFGKIRCRIGGGSAGNNGVKSLISHIGEDFGRVRVGIKNNLLDKIDSADFVLSKFNAEERQKVEKVTKEVSSILSEYTASNQLPNDTRSVV